MKAGREHRVPLSGPALLVLAEARHFSGGSALVFPSAKGTPFASVRLAKLLRDLGVKAVPHGFRTSFRVWCGDTGVAREVAEAALAHTIKNKSGRLRRGTSSSAAVRSWTTGAITC